MLLFRWLNIELNEKPNLRLQFDFKTWGQTHTGGGDTTRSNSKRKRPNDKVCNTETSTFTSNKSSKSAQQEELWEGDLSDEQTTQRWNKAPATSPSSRQSPNYLFRRKSNFQSQEETKLGPVHLPTPLLSKTICNDTTSAMDVMGHQLQPKKSTFSDVIKKWERFPSFEHQITNNSRLKKRMFCSLRRD